MKRILTFLLPAVFLAQMVSAQQQDQIPTSHRFWEYRSGITIERFQDLKVSQVTLSGPSLPVGVYRGWGNDEHRSAIGLNLRAGVMTSSINDLTELVSLVIGLNYERLYALNAEVPFFEQWYLGGRADFRIQRLTNDKLGNSANNAIYNTGFSIVNHFERPFNLFKKEAKLTYTLSLGLLNYVKEDNSFAFAVPQDALEGGEFNTQDFENSLFEYGDIVTLNKFSNIQSRIAIHFPPRKRASWTIAYDWQLGRYTKIADRPATSAAHSLSIAYHIPKKKK